MSSFHQELEFTRFSNQEIEAGKKNVALEKEVSLYVNGEIWLGLHCSPDHLEALAAGFLYNEFFIESKDEIEMITNCGEGAMVEVWLKHGVKKPDQWSRSSGCTGEAQRSNLDQIPLVVEPNSVSIHDILRVTEEFYAILSAEREKFAGLHTTGLWDHNKLVFTSEDIGRRNTLDKIAGDCLLNSIQPGRPALITTGRLSSDMVQKATRINSGVVISLHSATTMAVQIAHRLGVTLVGHARPDSAEVYTHKERIVFSI